MVRINLIVIFLWLLTTLHATEYVFEDVNRDNNKSSTWIVLPYAFSSASTGFTGGAVGIFHGFIQPQMTMVVTAFAGETIPVNEFNLNGVNEKKANAKGLFVAITSVRIPYTERLFVSYLGMQAYYPNQSLYVDGSNDSIRKVEDANATYLSPFQTQGWSNWTYLDLRYVLPLGSSSTQVLPIIKANRGIAVNRDHVGGGLPFVTGQTIVGVKPFYQRWTADKLDPNAQISTNGYKAYIEHDNTDYPDNPSRGYNFKLTFAQDLGAFNSTQAWNTIEAEYSQYIELPLPSWARQNVVALNFWSAYAPSWDQSQYLKREDGSDSVINKGATPVWEGGRLGGFDRLRAYDSNRFHDKAAIYGALEYRVIPNLNPMQGQKWSPIPIDWFQGVLFGEVGRVAPEYNAELLKDVKYDAGFSIRALAATVPVRFDMAWGTEGATMWVMLKQPF